jgi:hypothetical protein
MDDDAILRELEKEGVPIGDDDIMKMLAEAEEDDEGDLLGLEDAGEELGDAEVLKAAGIDLGEISRMQDLIKKTKATTASELAQHSTGAAGPTRKSKPTPEPKAAKAPDLARQLSDTRREAEAALRAHDMTRARELITRAEAIQTAMKGGAAAVAGAAASSSSSSAATTASSASALPLDKVLVDRISELTAAEVELARKAHDSGGGALDRQLAMLAHRWALREKAMCQRELTCIQNHTLGLSEAHSVAAERAAADPGQMKGFVDALSSFVELARVAALQVKKNSAGKHESLREYWTKTLQAATASIKAVLDAAMLPYQPPPAITSSSVTVPEVIEPCSFPHIPPGSLEVSLKRLRVDPASLAGKEPLRVVVHPATFSSSSASKALELDWAPPRDDAGLCAVSKAVRFSVMPSSAGVSDTIMRRALRTAVKLEVQQLHRGWFSSSPSTVFAAWVPVAGLIADGQWFARVPLFPPSSPEPPSRKHEEWASQLDAEWRALQDADESAPLTGNWIEVELRMHTALVPKARVIKRDFVIPQLQSWAPASIPALLVRAESVAPPPQAIGVPVASASTAHPVASAGTATYAAAPPTSSSSSSAATARVAETHAPPPSYHGASSSAAVTPSTASMEDGDESSAPPSDEKIDGITVPAAELESPFFGGLLISMTHLEPRFEELCKAADKAKGSEAAQAIEQERIIVGTRIDKLMAKLHSQAITPADYAMMLETRRLRDVALAKALHKRGRKADAVAVMKRAKELFDDCNGMVAGEALTSADWASVQEQAKAQVTSEG